MRCDGCSGSGICDACSGYGYFPDSPETDYRGTDCFVCDGTTECADCDGDGITDPEIDENDLSTTTEHDDTEHDTDTEDTDVVALEMRQ